MKIKVKLWQIILISCMVIIIGLLVILINLYGYRYVNGDYKNLRLGDSKQIVIKKLHYLLESGIIRNGSFWNIPDGFSVVYFGKNACVNLTYKDNCLYQIYIINSKSYAISEYDLGFKKEITEIRRLLIAKFGQPNTNYEFLSLEALRSKKSLSRNRNYTDILLGRWLLRNKIVDYGIRYTSWQWVDLVHEDCSYYVLLRSRHKKSSLLKDL